MKMEVWAAIHIKNSYRHSGIRIWERGRIAILQSLILAYDLDRKEIADEIRLMRNKERG